MVYLQGVIRKEGLTIGGTDGKATKAHPALRQLESCRAHVLKMLESFGLTARSKKHVKETRVVSKDNPYAKYNKAGVRGQDCQADCVPAGTATPVARFQRIQLTSFSWHRSPTKFCFGAQSGTVRYAF
jgi:hypothetical protein